MTWKDQYFWWCEIITIIACAIVFLSLGERAGTEESRERWAKEMNKPATVHVIVHYQPIETTHLTQWVGEVATDVVRQGKRSMPGKLSPEMEHRRMVRGILDGKTTKTVIEGPEGLDAPWKRPLQ